MSDRYTPRVTNIHEYMRATENRENVSSETWKLIAKMDYISGYGDNFQAVFREFIHSLEEEEYADLMSELVKGKLL